MRSHINCNCVTRSVTVALPSLHSSAQLQVQNVKDGTACFSVILNVNMHRDISMSLK
jgi:hypothetical protein